MRRNEGFEVLLIIQARAVEQLQKLAFGCARESF
jgi:hypothetical protein